MGVLLDTHAAVWLINGNEMSAEAYIAIEGAQAQGDLLIAPISSWEASVALQKRAGTRRPDLGGLDGAAWFSALLQLPGVRLAEMSPAIALEAARCPDILGWADPGDCFIVATAHILRVPLVTRDADIIRFAAASPGYLDTIKC